MKKLLICAVAAALLFYGYGFRDISHLRGGEWLGSWLSPDGAYTVSAYLCDGGATTAFGVRVEAAWENHRRNIYWQYRQTEAEAAWLSDRVVQINGVPLDVRWDTYDWRRYKNARAVQDAGH